MKKIISLFQRNYDGNRLVRNELVPGAEWVTAGEGIATRKYDGTCCLIKDGALFKRYDAKTGREVPPEFMGAQAPDPKTGHWPGWVPVNGDAADTWHREAFNRSGFPREDGTYELVGPKIQGNPEQLEGHWLIRHGVDVLADCPRTFDALRAYLVARDIEGIVWHHPDGRMVKIKGKDFGLRRGGRPIKKTVFLPIWGTP